MSRDNGDIQYQLFAFSVNIMSLKVVFESSYGFDLEVWYHFTVCSIVGLGVCQVYFSVTLISRFVLVSSVVFIK